MLTIVGRGPNRGRTYRTFTLDGIRTIGVVPGEEYAIIFTPSGPDAYKRTKILVSVDDLNPLNGQPVVDDPNQPGYIIEHPRSIEIANWTKDSRGGAGLIFGTPEFAVGSYKPTAVDSALGYISVSVYVEGTPGNYHPTGFNGPSTIGGLESLEAPAEYGGDGPYDAAFAHPERGSGATGMAVSEPAVGTGLGPRVEKVLSSTRPLMMPRHSGLEQVRYMPLEQLRARLPQHPTGFQPRPIADMSGVPRMDDQGSEQFVSPGVSRFA